MSAGYRERPVRSYSIRDSHVTQGSGLCTRSSLAGELDEFIGGEEHSSLSRYVNASSGV
jgi:hypothetical protein